MKTDTENTNDVTGADSLDRPVRVSYELQHTAVEGKEHAAAMLAPVLTEVESVCNAALANALAHDKRPLQFAIRVIAGRIHVEVRGVSIETPKEIAERFISANAYSPDPNHDNSGS